MAQRNWQVGIIKLINKKGDSNDFKNLGVLENCMPEYRKKKITIAIGTKMEKIQCAFRKNREINDHIFLLKQLTDKIIQTVRQPHLCFFDM